MTTVTSADGWPEPYLQPNPKQDCTFYATAYLARCLGHPETTAQDIMAWRRENNRHEERYLSQALDIPTRGWWQDREDPEVKRQWWLGPDARDWVRSWLAGGHLAYVAVHRIPTTYHAVALLDAIDDRVLLMDPIYGHITESWEWLLGDGAVGTSSVHHVNTWHRPRASRP